MSDASDLQRIEAVKALRAELEHKYRKPMLPVPVKHGALVDGHVVDILPGPVGDPSGKVRAVVVSGRAVHVLGLKPEVARALRGQRVRVASNRGNLEIAPFHGLGVRNIGEPIEKLYEGVLPTVQAIRPPSRDRGR